MSGKYLYDRTWNVTISKNGNTLIEFSNDKNDYRITFDCRPYAYLGFPSLLVMQIYNIDQKIIGLFEPGVTITFSVGYKLAGSGLIFDGQVHSFYGRELATQSDKNYIFEIYALAYKYVDNPSDSLESKPKTFDLPKGTISSQAQIIGNYYGYQEDSKNVLSSVSSKQSGPIKFVAYNMDDALLQFYKKTKYSLSFNSKSKTYNITAAQPDVSQRQEINNLTSSRELYKIDDNSGMIGYPSFDSQTFFAKATSLINHEIDYFTPINLDVSNTQIDNIEKNLSQQVVVNSRLYKRFSIKYLSYNGDTRGTPWYQKMLMVGTG